MAEFQTPACVRRNCLHGGGEKNPLSWMTCWPPAPSEANPSDTPACPRRDNSASKIQRSLYSRIETIALVFSDAPLPAFWACLEEAIYNCNPEMHLSNKPEKQEIR